MRNFNDLIRHLRNFCILFVTPFLCNILQKKTNVYSHQFSCSNLIAPKNGFKMIKRQLNFVDTYSKYLSFELTTVGMLGSFWSFWCIDYKEKSNTGHEIGMYLKFCNCKATPRAFIPPVTNKMTSNPNPIPKHFPIWVQWIVHYKRNIDRKIREKKSTTNIQIQCLTSYNPEIEYAALLLLSTTPQ